MNPTIDPHSFPSLHSPVHPRARQRRAAGSDPERRPERRELQLPGQQHHPGYRQGLQATWRSWQAIRPMWSERRSFWCFAPTTIVTAR